MHASFHWLFFAVFIAFTLVLYAWGVWVARRQATPLYRLAARGILVGAVIALAGATWAAQQLATVTALPPEGSADGATQYAQGISGSLTLAALPIGMGNLVVLASVVVLLIGTLRRPAS